MKYDKKEVLQLLDADTIIALLKVVNLKYKHVAGRLNISRQAIVYLMKHDAYKDWQKEIILEMLLQHGCEVAEIMLVHQMVNKAKKVKHYE
ncbi:hypothetical protein VBD025_03930 [Virgibacillus flavescens]|uniref:hypothetical protein n=1 Tax=Virgibacillus flavescens TaxID=1611422 RepID=UPI003D339D6B